VPTPVRYERSEVCGPSGSIYVELAHSVPATRRNACSSPLKLASGLCRWFAGRTAENVVELVRAKSLWSYFSRICGGDCDRM
jgi:hypothetical protein